MHGKSFSKKFSYLPVMGSVLLESRFAPICHCNLDCNEIAAKTLQLCNCILRALQHRHVYTVHCHPVLKYYTQVTSPHLTNDTKTAENVQEFHVRFALRKMFVGPGYKRRLKAFDLEAFWIVYLSFRWLLLSKSSRAFLIYPKQCPTMLPNYR